MTWTLPAGWLAAMRKSGARPVVVARIVTQPWASLNVVDYTQAVNGDTITVGTVVITAGTHFTASVSNATTALSIAAGFNTRATALGAAYWARARGNRVYFMQRDYTGTFAGGTTPNLALGVVSSRVAFAAVHQDGESAFHNFVSGPEPLFGYMPHIDRISPIEWEVDPVSREFDLSGVDVVFGQRGQAIRNLMLFHDLISVPVRLFLGTPELTFANFLELPTTLVQDIESDETTVVLKCRGADSLFQGAKITGASFVSDHPLQVTEASLIAGGITNALTYPNLTTSIFDFTTLAPGNFPSKGHFNLSRYWANDGGEISPEMKNAITEPESVWNIMQDMAMLMYGTFMPSQTGVWRYIDYNPAASPTYTFRFGSQDNANPGLYGKITGCKAGGTNAITEIEWELAGIGEVGNESSVVVRRFAFNQNFTHRQSRKTTFSTPWLNGVFRFLNVPIPQPDTADGGTEDKIGWEARIISYNYVNGLTNLGSGNYDNTENFHTNGAARQGLCGARYTFNSGTWAFERVTESTLEGDTGGAGSGRRAFVMFVGPGGYNQPATAFREVEIMAIDQIELEFSGSSSITPGVTADDPVVYEDLRFRQGHTEERVPHQYTVRLYIDTAYTQPTFDGFTNGRGGYGTNIPNQWGSQSSVSGGAGPSVPDVPYIVDVTIPMVISDIILNRFKYGAPEVSFVTPLHEIDKEPTDFVQLLGAENYLGYTSDGTSQQQVFEIIKKSLDIFSENPRIEWKAVLVRNDDLPPTINVASPNWPGVVVGVQIPVTTVDDPVTDNAGIIVEIDTNGDGIDDEVVYRG